MVSDTAIDAVARQRRIWLQVCQLFGTAGPTVVTIIGSLAFALTGWIPGDLWAAMARESAASSGVGPTYWFAWFGGASAPGDYSILVPSLCYLFGTVAVGVLATSVVPAICQRVFRGAKNERAAMWVVSVSALSNLWSGRIAFAVGLALACGTVYAVRERRSFTACIGAVLVVLASPVAGAFVAFGLIVCGARAASHRRACLLAACAATAALGVIGLLFGDPGVEPFSVSDAGKVAFALLVLLIARPARWLVTLLLVGLFATVALTVVPNALGSNVERLVWLVLPAAVIATARAHRVVAILCSFAALAPGLASTDTDIAVARAPESSVGRYDPLIDRLERTGATSQYRLEVVSDGTHTAAFALLNHAQLARGYETQVDQQLNHVLFGRLTAADYRQWLDDNAVGYVALGRQVIARSSEYDLVSRRLPYLRAIWRNRNWVLFAVDRPEPIVTGPGRAVRVSQSALVVSIPAPTHVLIRIRWSRYLQAEAMKGVDPDLAPGPAGWTDLSVNSPSVVRLSG